MLCTVYVRKRFPGHGECILHVYTYIMYDRCEWDPHTCANTHEHTPEYGRRVEVLQHSVLRRVYSLICVCAAMFNETTGAVCPSHNKYTRLSPRHRHPVAVVLRLPVHLVIAFPPAPPPRLRPQQPPPPPVLPLSSLPFNRKRHFIVLYTRTRTNVHTTSLAVQLRNDDVSPPPTPLLNIPPLAVAAVFAPQTHHYIQHTHAPLPPSLRQPSPSRRTPRPISSLIYYRHGTWPPVDIFTRARFVVM